MSRVALLRAVLGPAALVLAACSPPASMLSDASAVSCDCLSWQHCDRELGRCSQCLTDAHCGGGTRCDRATGECVRCVESSDCDAWRPHCREHECRECLVSADCPGRDEAYCNEIGWCEGCFFDEDCAHVPGLPFCESARCVECSPRDERPCGAGVCDARTHTCVDRAPRSRDVCEECVSDLECQDGQLCVDGAFGRPGAAPSTAYCLWRSDAPSPGPGGSCFGARPFVDLRLLISIGGVSAGVCATPFVGCEALRDFRTTRCTDEGEGGAPIASAECGDPARGDGLCAPFGATERRCTIRCDAHEGCPCADPDCAAHYRCIAGADPSSGDTRACDLESTCALADPSCWTTR